MVSSGLGQEPGGSDASSLVFLCPLAPLSPVMEAGTAKRSIFPRCFE